ncbi:hypothetical protein [Anabaena lutea]|uniref:Uncharacterized protein n=1 Tax=Anabaena lutea FACHB-196 TaxID=2692881 RepID=A0ABR8FIS1_9NOST|nr:hypothetical protein [Anabaena lutea]MBD2570013.1 hypothetical protein [Anabaena lutea FACHB-196]
MSGLILTVNDLELKITKFLSPRFPRGRIGPLPSIEYSANGSSILDGPIFPIKFLWSINASLDLEETDILQAIYSESDYNRRNLTGPLITLTDNTLSFVEHAPRTRPLAAGSTETTISNNQIKYFAKFQTFIIQSPEIDEQGIHNAVSFTLQEI